jgi:plastocyanin
MLDAIWRRRRGAGIALLAGFCLLAVNATASAGENVTVSIDNFTFKPQVLTIKPGTTVTFVNHDDIPHTIVDKGGKFRSKVLDTEESFKITFDASGDITYFCSLHPHMTGQIIVAP